jgi:hypothetical protein
MFKPYKTEQGKHIAKFLTGDKKLTDAYRTKAFFETGILFELDFAETGCNQSWSNGSNRGKIHIVGVVRNEKDPGFVHVDLYCLGNRFKITGTEDSSKLTFSSIILSSVLLENVNHSITRDTFPLLNSWVSKNPQFWYCLVRTHEANKNNNNDTTKTL